MRLHRPRTGGLFSLRRSRHGGPNLRPVLPPVHLRRSIREHWIIRTFRSSSETRHSTPDIRIEDPTAGHRQILTEATALEMTANAGPATEADEPHTIRGPCGTISPF